jgi:predicted secreted hydrolase
MKKLAMKKVIPVLTTIILITIGGIFLTIRLFSPEATPEETAIMASIQQIDGFRRATGDTPVIFPEALGPHPDYQTEWWYYTGNLQTASGRHFGYQFTIFRRALLPATLIVPRSSDWAVDQVYLGHFALTDTQSNTHYAFERFARGAGGLAGAQAEPYHVWLEDWRIQENETGQITITASQDGIAVKIALTDLKGYILHGIDGYSQKGPDPGNASYYYSQTRLATIGEVVIDNTTHEVTGFSWKDHEYSTSALTVDQVGWDWFALQLDDGTELKVFHIRRSDGSIDPFSSGSFIDQDANVLQLRRDDFSIDVLATWKSPVSGAQYPARWKITVPELNLSLELTPTIADQELKVSYVYWEGAVTIQGYRADSPLAGFGYVEMTGYAGSMGGEF